MALSGNTREFSLADLIVVKARDPRSHRLTLIGPAGDGLLLIESGRIVHAAYGELPPLVDARGSSEPLASNAELDGRRSNRRVDVWILPH